MSIAAEAQLPAPWRVIERRQDTADVFTWQVAPLGDAGIDCAPGQFNMLYAHGIGEVPVSIAGVGEGGTLLHTVRAVGSVTRALAGLAAGTVIGLRGPYGTAWPLDAAAGGDVVIVAGGLGLAPLRQAIVQVLSQRERYGRVCILYGTRTPADVLYGGELAAWATHLTGVTPALVLLPAPLAVAGSALLLSWGVTLWMRHRRTRDAWQRDGPPSAADEEPHRE